VVFRHRARCRFGIATVRGEHRLGRCVGQVGIKAGGRELARFLKYLWLQGEQIKIFNLHRTRI